MVRDIFTKFGTAEVGLATRLAGVISAFNMSLDKIQDGVLAEVFFALGVLSSLKCVSGIQGILQRPDQRTYNLKIAILYLERLWA